jgi:hypothetical protein
MNPNREKTPIFFIYQNGFRQISLPPRNSTGNNPDVITITSCDDGVLITTDEAFEKTVVKLNEFVGYPITEIWCDNNSIAVGDYFRGAVIKRGNYDEKVICLHFYGETHIKYKAGLYLYSQRQEATFCIKEVQKTGFLLINENDESIEVTDLTDYRIASMDERAQYQMNQSKRGGKIE